MKNLLLYLVSSGLLLLSACSITKNQTESGFVSLFNGKTLADWVGNKQSYKVDNGTILVDPKGKGGGNLYTAE